MEFDTNACVFCFCVSFGFGDECFSDVVSIEMYMIDWLHYHVMCYVQSVGLVNKTWTVAGLQLTGLRTEERTASERRSYCETHRWKWGCFLLCLWMLTVARISIFPRAVFVKFSQRGIRVLSFDIRTGTMPQLGTSIWWKVVRSARLVCIRDGR